MENNYLVFSSLLSMQMANNNLNKLKEISIKRSPIHLNKKLLCPSCNALSTPDNIQVQIIKYNESGRPFVKCNHCFAQWETEVYTNEELQFIINKCKEKGININEKLILENDIFRNQEKILINILYDLNKRR